MLNKGMERQMWACQATQLIIKSKQMMVQGKQQILDLAIDKCVLFAVLA